MSLHFMAITTPKSRTLFRLPHISLKIKFPTSPVFYFIFCVERRHRVRCVWAFRVAFFCRKGISRVSTKMMIFYICTCVHDHITDYNFVISIVDYRAPASSEQVKFRPDATWTCFNYMRKHSSLFSELWNTKETVHPLNAHLLWPLLVLPWSLRPECSRHSTTCLYTRFVCFLLSCWSKKTRII